MRRFFFRTLLLSTVVFFSSWGFLVHRTIHQLAVYELPKPMQSFFYKSMNYLVENAGRPDQRRNQDSTEASKHFIDLEAFGDSAAWKAGTPVGHCLENRSEQVAQLLVVGTKAKIGVVHYSDYGIVMRHDEGGRSFSRADGSALPDPAHGLAPQGD